MNINNKKYRFQFKQFGINDSDCAMKVGTDGVLLGAWADFSSSHNIIDVGSGSGLISLMAAQRSKASITGIEIDSKASQQSIININESPWYNRISIINADFIKWAGNSNLHHQFDHIVSNPPFFNNGPSAPSLLRATARHGNSLGYEQLIQSSKLLMSDNAKLSFISPFERKDDIIFYCDLAKLYISKLTNVYSKDGGNIVRILWEIVNAKCNTIYSEITIRSKDNKYNKEYIDLTKDFYLNLN